jgi:ABC-type Na+ efflux pump permease subunit
VFRQVLVAKILGVALYALKQLGHSSIGGTSLLSSVASNAVLDMHWNRVIILTEVL